MYIVLRKYLFKGFYYSESIASELLEILKKCFLVTTLVLGHSLGVSGKHQNKIDI